jgi:hypothetical protein
MKKFHKITSLVLGILFIGFAYLQLNDPDPYLWVSIYLLTTIAGITVSLRSIFRLKKFLFIVIAIHVVWIATLTPDFIHYVEMGMPNITGEMQAKKPFIEAIRELGGLVIALLVNIYFYRAHEKIRA